MTLSVGCCFRKTVISSLLPVLIRTFLKEYFARSVAAESRSDAASLVDLIPRFDQIGATVRAFFSHAEIKITC